MHVWVVRGFVTLVCRAHSRDGQRETDKLLRALVEAEIDGVAVANQLNGLKETIDSFAKVKLVPNHRFAPTVGQEDKGLIQDR